VTNARILIVDDHPLVREGLSARISAQAGLEVCGEADDVETALQMIHRHEPDLVIVDITLSSGHGLDLIKQARQRQNPPKMLVVSAHDETLLAPRVLRAGAQGYVNKQEAQQKVVDAITSVLRGEQYLSDQMTQQLVGSALNTRRPRAAGIEGLSDRELQIFEQIGRGRGTRAIAEDLQLSVHTVETHRENIRAKLGLRSGNELVRSAVQWVIESGSGS